MTLIRYFVVLIPALLLLLLNSCETGHNGEGGGLSTEGHADTLKIATVNWDENKAMSHLVKHIIEKEMNYRVIFRKYVLEQVYTKVANGELDLFLSAWKPLTHQEYLEDYGDRLLDLGPNCGDAKIGLVVPGYVPIESIPQLAGFQSKVQGRIFGIEEDAGVVKHTNRAIEAYDLNYRVFESNENAMISTLEASFKSQEPIVITGWIPHWVFTKHDLRFLDDPKNIFGDTESIHTVARKGLEEEYPAVVNFLRNFKLTGEQMLTIMEKMTGTDQPVKKVVEDWVANNENVVQEWLEKNPQQDGN